MITSLPESKAVSYKHLMQQGLWHNNPVLVQLLGLCPLLAVSTQLAQGLGLGIATIMVLTISNVLVACFRHSITPAIRLPLLVMIIATMTTCAERLIQAFAFDLYLNLGIFIPLIVTNCAVLGRAEAFASKNPILGAGLDGMMMGLGFTWVLCLVSGVREYLGQTFLLAILPPGAFITLGGLLALKRSP